MISECPGKSDGGSLLLKKAVLPQYSDSGGFIGASLHKLED